SFLQRVKLTNDTTTPTSTPALATPTDPPTPSRSAITNAAGAASTLAFNAGTCLDTTTRFSVGSSTPRATFVGTSGGAGVTTGGVSSSKFETASVVLSDASRTALINASTGASALNLPATQIEVAQQAPIVGKSLDFRTATVAERLTDSIAPETKSFTVA